MIEFRDYKEVDFSDLTEIVARTWDYSKYGLDPKWCKIRAEEDFLFCLSQSNYAEVACIKDKPVGILLGRLESKPLEDKYDLKREYKKLLFDCLFNKTGRLIYDYSQLYDEVDEKLLKDTRNHYDAEIVLLFIDPGFKHKNIGKKLVEHFKNFVKDSKGKTVFLFTDSTCDMAFYDKIGFSSKGHEKRKAALRNDEIIDFYIYDFDLV